MPGSDLLHAAQPAHRCGEVAAAGDCSASLVIPGVSTGPGHSAQTRILRGASSIAQERAKLRIGGGHVLADGSTPKSAKPRRDLSDADFAAPPAPSDAAAWSEPRVTSTTPQCSSVTLKHDLVWRSS